MTREEAMRSVLQSAPPDAVLVAANGHTSRQLYALQDRPSHFYMLGSMGLASSIALGIVLARPERRVVVFDGDGNVLMNPGSLASVGARRPAHFVHVCFDNARHASTGGQRTIADRVALEKVAAAAGYVWARRAERAEQAQVLVREALAQEGPAFLLVKVEPGGLPEGTPRVEPTPEDMTARLRRFLAS